MLHTGLAAPDAFGIYRYSLGALGDGPGPTPPPGADRQGVASSQMSWLGQVAPNRRAMPLALWDVGFSEHSGLATGPALAGGA